jgi:putative ATP-grasp target RiPP
MPGRGKKLLALNTRSSPERRVEVLAEVRHQFPLGRAFDDVQEDAPSGVQPFGLKYAVKPAETVEVDVSTLAYDADRQISAVSVGGIMIPAMKHTSTRTTTHTGDRNPGDSDEDSTGS